MDKTIARNIKKLRETVRYTPNDMALAIGITGSAYSNYESGELPNRTLGLAQPG